MAWLFRWLALPRLGTRETAVQSFTRVPLSTVRGVPPGVCLGHAGSRRCLAWRDKVCGLGIEGYNRTLVELVILWPLERGVPNSPVGEPDFNNLLTPSHLTLDVDS